MRFVPVVVLKRRRRQVLWMRWSTRLSYSLFRCSVPHHLTRSTAGAIHASRKRRWLLVVLVVQCVVHAPRR